MGDRRPIALQTLSEQRTTVLARVPIGLALQSDAPPPNIRSVEAFKRTLLDATSIAHVDSASGGASGIFLAQTFERLGIAAALVPAAGFS